MPEGPDVLPAGMNTDQPPPVFVAELVREKLLSKTRDEIPHSIAVVTEDYEERDDGLLEINATHLRRAGLPEGHRDREGRRDHQAVGTEAREEIETLFGRKVFLDLRVKVEKDWQRRAHALDRLGFDR